MVTRGPGHRGDIDGLRAVAVLAVVAFHARVAGFTGGFVGVDVFFVISGFLITRQLVAEADREGGVGLVGFWARRVRRLVPPLVLLVVVTLAVSAVVLAPVDLPEVGRQGLAASLYLSNLLFAGEAGDYFGADLEASPFLHTWSLGVEEQFYLLWPLLVVGLVAVAGPTAARRRRVLAGGFAVVAAGSLALAVWQTPRSPSWAFYGLHTRAWEFALAGALALVPATRWERLPGSVRLATGWIGAAAVAWAVVAFDATTPYPGTAALVPVLGTLALLVAGSSTARAGSVPWLLDTGPTRWLGRVSYSWYLWHWPAIVLTVAVVDDPGTRTRVAAALGSLAVAAAVHHLVENPVRFSPALAASSRRTLVLGGLLTLVAVAAAVVAPRVAPVEDRDLAAELAAARADRSRDDCEREERTDEGLAYCVSGAPDGTATVLLVGDSHARHWKAALGEAAARAGVRLVDRWHPRCPAVAVAISPPGGGGLDHELVRGCLEHRRGTDRLLEELAPEVVVVSDSRGYTPLVLTDAGETQPRARQAEQWATRFDELLARIEAVGATPVVVLDNPRLPEDPVTCLSARGDEDACAPPADEALATIAELQDAELAVLDRRRAEGREVLTFSVTEDICGGDRCVLRDRGELVWADQGHFTTAFTTTRVDELVEVLERSLDRRG